MLKTWVWSLVALMVVALLGHYLGAVLAPFLVAFILAYLGNPLVDRLNRGLASRTLAVCLVFGGFSLLALLGLLLILPGLEAQLLLLANKWPKILDWLNLKLFAPLKLSLAKDFSVILAKFSKDISQLANVGSILTGVLSTLSRSGMAVILWLANLLLVPLVVFYLLRDWHPLMQRLEALLPRPQAGLIRQMARDCDQVLGHFIRGQLLVMLALTGIYTLGLMLVGLDLALLIGLISGLASVVPYLGIVVGMLCAGVAALVEFQSASGVAAVCLVFVVGQLLEGMILTPLLVGDRIGLHPVAVIFAVLAGGELFGFFGVLLALPVAAVLVVLGRYGLQRYLASPLYRGDEAVAQDVLDHD